MRPSRGQVLGTLGAVALLAALMAVGRLDAPGRPRRAAAPAPASTTATPPTPPTTARTVLARQRTAHPDRRSAPRRLLPQPDPVAARLGAWPAGLPARRPGLPRNSDTDPVLPAG